MGCERPPVDTVQLGFRGVGQELVANPRLLADQVAATVVPTPEPPAAPVPLKAIQSYPELKLLGDLSLTEFNRQMAAFTKWIAPPEQGCAYCHNLENMASYEKYTKTVALAMIKMTQDTNANWKDHVGDTGVTCWTCHRGKGVPEYAWNSESGPDQPARFVSARQNIAAPTVAYASLPFDPLTAFLDRADTPISVVSSDALPTGANDTGIKHAEWTYGLMMYMSDSLGVNCTYCHNSRAFYSWEQESRVKAWYAIRHVRKMNRDYVWPLTDILPASRKGPAGDPKRIACMTCHQGAYKPLFGVPMLKDYPALAGPIVSAAAGTGASAAPPAAVLTPPAPAAELPPPPPAVAPPAPGPVPQPPAAALTPPSPAMAPPAMEPAPEPPAMVLPPPPPAVAPPAPEPVPEPPTAELTPPAPATVPVMPAQPELIPPPPPGPPPGFMMPPAPEGPPAFIIPAPPATPPTGV
jgi:photosynthetic reaction center cytochrome c subunit